MTNLLRRVFRTCVIVGLPLLCHCDDRVMVHIRVTGAPSTVRTLRVFAELNGKPALSADEFQDPLQEVNLVLPRSALGEGKLFVSIIGLDASDCRVGYGKLITEVQAAPQKTEAEVSLTGLPTICNWRQSGWGSYDSKLADPKLEWWPSACQGIWGSDERNIWIVGSSGSVLYWNGGKDWVVQASGNLEELGGVWGQSAASVWAVGGGCTIVNGNSSTPKWSGWEKPCKVQVNGKGIYLADIWGPDLNNMWAVGGNGLGGALLKRNPSDGTWAAIENLPSAPEYLEDVWGTDANNVWAVGSGTVLHWRDNMWIDQKPSGAPHLSGVWGSDVSSVWIVGHGSTILRSTVSGWSKENDSWGADFAAVWGADARNVWAVGERGTVVKWDGVRWVTQATGTSSNLFAVWGSDAFNVWTVGHRNEDSGKPIAHSCTILHYSRL